MGQYGKMLADAATVGLRYGRRLLDTIPDERFARVAQPGGTAVHSNHPAFNIGHLTLYPAKVAELLGADTRPASPPANYEAIFSKDSQCADDPDGTIYPRKSEIIEVFYRTYEAALDALRNCDDSLLLSENPIDSPIKKICPTLGSMLAFYVSGHVTSHLGQISTWRRMEGMPSV